MSQNNEFLEKTVLELGRKVDVNHNALKEDITDIKNSLIKMESALVFHGQQDGAAQNRASKLEERMDKVETPYRAIQGLLWFMGALALVAGAVKAMMQLAPLFRF